VTWDGETAESLAQHCGAKRLELFDVTDSTLDVAHALAQDGAESGTVVLADAQRAGRGQFGRIWSSEPGRGVWCTVIARNLEPKALEVLSLRVGLEIAERLDPIAGTTVGVKWPNDLILYGAKLGGVLVEARWSGTALSWVAVGVGVNVERPDSYAAAAGMPRGVARRAVLAAIVAGVGAATAASGHLSTEERARFQVRDVLRGHRIVEPVAGTVAGVESNGALLVVTRTKDVRIKNGTIRMAEGR
jgi:BirA family biotin operon repressor/biotin-[acetyl-CoA-carboxylase] ligase